MQGRVTPQDKAAVQLLARGTSDDELRTFFETLRFKRTDQSGLCTADLLRRCAALPRAAAVRAWLTTQALLSRSDYKEWVMNGWRVGVSAIGLPLAEVVSRGESDPVDAALARWRESRNLDFLLVMSSHSAGGTFQRELGTNAQGGAAVALLPQLVSSLASSQLTLQPLQLPPPGWPAPGAAFAQRDVKSSRKVVQPLLVQFFAANAK